MYNANTNQKKAGVALLISNKTDFTARENYQRIKRILYNSERISSSERQQC